MGAPLSSSFSTRLTAIWIVHRNANDNGSALALALDAHWFTSVPDTRSFSIASSRPSFFIVWRSIRDGYYECQEGIKTCTLAMSCRNHSFIFPRCAPPLTMPPWHPNTHPPRSTLSILPNAYTIPLSRISFHCRPRPLCYLSSQFRHLLHQHNTQHIQTQTSNTHQDAKQVTLPFLFHQLRSRHARRHWISAYH